MDDNSHTLIAGGLGTAFTVTLFVFYKFLVPFFNAANHRRVRSVCCGTTCVSSLDVEETTPRVATSGVGEQSGVEPNPKVSQVSPTLTTHASRRPSSDSKEPVG
jgi:hypothetical protein